MSGRNENQYKTETFIENKIEDMPEYLQRYYYSLSQKSHMTKLRYINNTIRFLNYYGKGDINNVNINKLNMIDSYIIERYISAINKEGKTPLTNTSKANILCSLSSFFRFLKRNKYIDNNPFEDGGVERPKAEQTEITYLTPEEVKKIESVILNGCGNARARGKQNAYKYRDLCLFRIPVVNGIRIEALREIDIDDVDIENKQISVIEKGNIRKKVYIDDTTLGYIALWKHQRNKIVNDDNFKPLFVSAKKERISARAIERVIEKYTAEATDKHITPHKLRSTFATNLYQQTKDIYLVADALGHKTTAPTKRYAKIFDDSRRNAVNLVADLYS